MEPLTFAALVGLFFLVWFILVLLFTPRIDYHLTGPLADEPALLHVLQASCETRLEEGHRVEVFTNGPRFYPAMLAAIREARHSINFEVYIFQPGQVADQLAAALAERAKAGVAVRMVVDAIGSSHFRWSAPAARLSEAGCRVERYQPLKWYRLHRINNRTHRELLIVDGRAAFIGGAGVADWWNTPSAPTHPAWRDTMVRVEGPVVASLQGVFTENWLECCGEILTSPICWPALTSEGPAGAMLIKSSPADRATTSRVAFQMLIAGARHTVDIATPYFLPDFSLRRLLVETAQRGVRVRVVLPGVRTDQRLVRLASRRLYRDLLAAGVHIYEYEPGMTHVKTLLIDDRWAVVGTTNFDNRSFEHNDEVNVAFRDTELTARLLEDFERDVASSAEISLEAWKGRPLYEKLLSPLSWILERQQ